jgi:hypothetical protein
VHAFNGRLEGNAYHPLDSTPIIAAAITHALLQQRARRSDRVSLPGTA